MSLVAVASAKASPGVTTACLALAAVWPQGRAVRIIEADPDGGTLAARLGLESEPGISTLAVAGRCPMTAEDIAGHFQTLRGGEVDVLAAPSTAEQVGRSLGLLADRLPRLLRTTPGTDSLIDVGRLRPGTPAWPLVEAADVVLLVSRPRLDELQQLPIRFRALRTAGVRAGLVLVGERPYPPAEIAAALHADVVGVLAEDARGAAALNGDSSVGFSRSPLLRSARDLADVIPGWITSPTRAVEPPTADTREPSAPLSEEVAG